jgi:EAL domain-containing protein (putative c-di-GMP-specific phosphodiesterase class I)
MGCDQYQGFHFSPPLAPAEFADLVRRQRRVEDESGLFRAGNS